MRMRCNCRHLNQRGQPGENPTPKKPGGKKKNCRKLKRVANVALTKSKSFLAGGAKPLKMTRSSIKCARRDFLLKPFQFVADDRTGCC